MRRLLIFILTIGPILSFGQFKSKLKRGFEALHEYNYFYAKECFEKAQKKHSLLANFGLASIYARNDNPFHNLDSAYRKLDIAKAEFNKIDPKDSIRAVSFGITGSSIDSLNSVVASALLELYQKNGTVADYELFISRFHGTPYVNTAIHKRDSLAFEKVLFENTENGYKSFIRSYPNSEYIDEAQELYEASVYLSYASSGNIEDFERYLVDHTSGPYKNEAENVIYALSVSEGTIEQYRNFIKKYPLNHNVELAWKNIYSIYTKDGSARTIAEFRFAFPEYPYLETVMQDLELALTNLYPVEVLSKWGFIDEKGEQRVAPMYDWVEPFTEGLAAVGLNEKGGFIDKQGRVIVPIEYDDVEPFGNEYAVVSKKDSFGLVDQNGKLVIPMKYEAVFEPFEGLAKVKTDDAFGYTAVENGKVHIPAIYESAGEFRGGLAWVSIKGKYSYINKEGKVVIPAEYDWASNFSGQLAKVKKGAYFGLLNKQGELVLQCVYDFIGDFFNGIALVVRGNKYGYCNQKGEFVIPLAYEYAPTIVDERLINGLIVFHSKSKYGVMNKTGDIKLKPFYDGVKLSTDGTVSVRKKDQWALMDTSFKLITPFVYQNLGSGNRLKVAQKKNLYGYIDSQGEEVIPFEFEDALPIRHNFGVVKKQGWGLINTKGEFLIDPSYVEIEVIDSEIARVKGEKGVSFYNLREKKFVFPQ